MRNSIRLAVTVTMLVLAQGAGAQGDSPALKTVEEPVLDSKIVTVGTARYGPPHSISIAPSALKTKAGVITTLPPANALLEEGRVLLSASGRPVFVLQGEIPVYRDLVPGTAGDDVRQLENALARLKFDPGPLDGVYDELTSSAVAQWYRSAEWEPFGPTVAQLTNIRMLEERLANAQRTKLANAGAAAAAAAAVASARATAKHANNSAAASVDAQIAARDKANANLANAALAVEAARATADHLLKRATAERAAMSDGQDVGVSASGTPLAVEAARAKAKYADQAAKADIATKVAERALVMVDPRQPETARAAADARLELAQAAALNVELQGQAAVQVAERDARLAAQRYELAEAAVNAAQLDGEVTIQAALNAQQAAEREVKLAERQLKLAQAAATIKTLEGEAAVKAAIAAQKVAEFDVKLAARQVAQFTADLEVAKRKMGMQVPADEIVFIRTLPVRMEQASVLVGDPASGPIMIVTDNQLAIESSLPLEAAALVKPGMKVAIDKQDLGIEATGVVDWVADTPGTRGVDGQQVYFRVRVDETPATLEGISLRLTIAIESTKGAASAVPVSALSLAGDETSGLQHSKCKRVEPRPCTYGSFEVTAVGGSPVPDRLVAAGYEQSAKAVTR